VNEYQLDSFIQLQEGATTVTTAALSHADIVTLREAHRTGAFVRARTNMSVGYAVLAVSATQSIHESDEQEHQTFSLVYSGEPDDSSSA
jgi:hypothetical protein